MISIVLSVSLIAQKNTSVNVFPASRTNNKALSGKQQLHTYNKNREDGVFYQYRNNKELTEKRDRTSKHFLNKNGSFTAVVSSGESLHYKDGGEWKDISTEIGPNTSGRNTEYDFGNVHNRFRSFYSASSDKGIKVELEEGDIIEWQNPGMAWVDINDNIIGSARTAGSVIGNVEKNSITYRSLFTGIDARFTQQSDGRKLDIVINNRSAVGNRPSGTKALVFYETVTFPSGWKVETQNGAGEVPGRDDIQIISLIDNNGQKIVSYLRPYFYDNNGTGSGNSAYGSYVMELNGNSLTVGIKIPVSWLLNQQRIYPVIIDPTADYYPDDIAWWTGRVYDDGDEYDGNLRVGWQDSSPDRWVNGWSKFDISGITDVATINDVDLYVYENSHEIGDDAGSGSEVTLYQVGFNSSSGDASWTEQVINWGSGLDPDIMFVELSTHPTGFGPPEGSHFIRFNSYTCSRGSEIALKQTIGFSTAGYTNIVLYFMWTMDGGWSASLDRVEIDWSTNGTSWNYLGWIGRYDPATGWYIISPDMPAGTEDQPAVYLRLRFIGEYGNDCHLDDVEVTGISSGVVVNDIYAYVVHLPLDPLTRTGAQKYNDIETGDSYGNITTFGDGVGWYNIDLGADGNTDLENSLAADWYAIGLNTYYADGSTDPNAGNDDNYARIGGHADANKPYIAVTYTDCTDPAGVDAGPNQGICADNTTLAGSAPGGGETGKWTVVIGSGTFTDDTDEGTTVSNVAEGPNAYRWTVTTDVGGCYSFDGVIITNNTPTTAAAGNDQTVCSSSAFLDGNDPAIGTGEWSVVSGSGVFTDNSIYNTEVNGLSTGANSFKWTITNGSCTGEDNVVITYNTPPSVDAGSDDDICADNTTLAGNDPAPGTGEWTVISGSGIFADNTLYNTTVSGLDMGDNTFRWTVTEDGCSDQDNVIITNSSGLTANAGPDQSVSISSTTLAGNDASPGTGLWTVVSGSGTFTDNSQYNTTVTSVGIGANEYRWTISYGACPPNSDNVIITYDADELGLIISGNLTNNGTMIHTADPNYFIMNGTAKLINGSAANNTYTNTKLWVNGSISFDGAINNGKFDTTYVAAGRTFTVNSARTFKNHKFLNSGTTTLQAASVFENSGDWVNSATVTANATSTVTFNGTAGQDVTSGGDNYGKVVINNTAVPRDTVTLLDDMTIATNATFLEGIVNTTLTEMMIFNDNSTSTVSFDSSYVNGPVRKIGTNDFTFPVGKPAVEVWRSIGIADLTGSETFTAEFFFQSPDSVGDRTALAPTVDHVSQYEYWILDRSGAVNAEVVLSWADSSGPVTNMADLIVARWGGALWEDEGNFATSGNNSYGTVTSEFVTIFSPFTLGSKTPANPLAIELLYFEAECRGDYVLLSWATVVEVDNDYFTIEKSNDGNSYKAIAVIEGEGNSNMLIQYSADDYDPIYGFTYYRLKQTDYNGDFQYYDPVVVECYSDMVDIFSFNVYPNPARNDQEIFVSFKGLDPEKEILVVVKDILGNLLYSKVVFSDYSGAVLEAVDPNNRLVPGIYLIIGSTKDEIYSKKFIIR